MRRLVRSLTFLTVAAIAATASASSFAQPSGFAIAVLQTSQAEGANGTRVLQTESPVYSGDRIFTGPVGEAQLKFRDDTRIVVGPNASMVIDAFIFDENDSARKISINAVRGAFRFISGKSPKDAYSIRTPTATMGIRG